MSSSLLVPFSSPHCCYYYSTFIKPSTSNIVFHGLDHKPSIADLYPLSLIIHRLLDKRVHSNKSLRQFPPSLHYLKVNFVPESFWIIFSFSYINASITSSTVYSQQYKQFGSVCVFSHLYMYQGGYYLCFHGWEKKFDCNFDLPGDQEWNITC